MCVVYAMLIRLGLQILLSSSENLAGTYREEVMHGTSLINTDSAML